MAGIDFVDCLEELESGLIGTLGGISYREFAGDEQWQENEDPQKQLGV